MKKYYLQIARLFRYRKSANNNKKPFDLAWFYTESFDPEIVYIY